MRPPHAWHRPWEWMGPQQGFGGSLAREWIRLTLTQNTVGAAAASPPPPSPPRAAADCGGIPATHEAPSRAAAGTRGGGGLAGMPETRVSPGRPAREGRGGWSRGAPGAALATSPAAQAARVSRHGAARSAEPGRAGVVLSPQPVPPSVPGCPRRSSLQLGGLGVPVITSLPHPPRPSPTCPFSYPATGGTPALFGLAGAGFYCMPQTCSVEQNPLTWLEAEQMKAEIPQLPPAPHIPNRPYYSPNCSFFVSPSRR